MPYIYLILSVLMSASTGVFGKLFNRRTEGKRNTSTFYNFLLMLSVLATWSVLYIAAPSFDVGVLKYSVLFAICYITCNVGIINALRHGPTAISMLFLNLSLIMTVIWGFIFWGDTATPSVMVGLALVVVSVILCLYSGEKEKKAFSWKWLINILLAFLGNAGCSIVQRTQQLHYGGQHGKMLMFFAAAASLALYIFIYLKSDRRDSGVLLKTSGWIPVCAGICNVVLNVFAILLVTTELSPSLIYPVICVGSLTVVTVFSLFIFKEKMKWWQWLGIAIGAVAVVLLSI